jgi:hypothetical protein
MTDDVNEMFNEADDAIVAPLLDEDVLESFFGDMDEVDWHTFDFKKAYKQRAKENITARTIERDLADLQSYYRNECPPLNAKVIREELRSMDTEVPDLSIYDIGAVTHAYAKLSNYSNRLAMHASNVNRHVEFFGSVFKMIRTMSLSILKTGKNQDKDAKADSVAIHLHLAYISVSSLSNDIKEIQKIIKLSLDSINQIVLLYNANSRINSGIVDESRSNMLDPVGLGVDAYATEDSSEDVPFSYERSQKPKRERKVKTMKRILY